MHNLEVRQLIKADIQEAWKFFSDPAMLERITPSGMGFRILRQTGTSMYAGMMITYKVSPLLGIPLTWVTEITHVKKNEYFVDEQRLGPYRIWHHQHIFREVEGGTEIIDLVDYALPLGFLGWILNRLIVRRKLQKIFQYREEQITKIFK